MSSPFNLNALNTAHANLLGLHSLYLDNIDNVEYHHPSDHYDVVGTVYLKHRKVWLMNYNYLGKFEMGSLRTYPTKPYMNVLREFAHKEHALQMMYLKQQNHE